MPLTWMDLTVYMAICLYVYLCVRASVPTSDSNILVDVVVPLLQEAVGEQRFVLEGDATDLMDLTVCLHGCLSVRLSVRRCVCLQGNILVDVVVPLLQEAIVEQRFVPEGDSTKGRGPDGDCELHCGACGVHHVPGALDPHRHDALRHRGCCV